MADYVQGTSPKKNVKYTYADYLTWPDDERWELINGIAYGMSPAPKTGHQRLSRELSCAIFNFLDDKSCEAFSAPFDVKLSEETIVQPDISVICDASKIDDKGCNGAPELAIEILSDSTAYKDETEKRLLYEKHGVLEYWIINPGLPELIKFTRGKNGFEKPQHLSKDELLTSDVLEGFELPLDKLFSSLGNKGE